MEEVTQAPKTKRTMTPEARERMLQNLAKGRDARKAKLAGRKNDEKFPMKENGQSVAKDLPENGQNDPPLERHKCPCGKSYKFVQGLNRHQATCKFLKAQAPTQSQPVTMEVSAPEPQADAEPVKRTKKKKKKMVIVESSSESEEEVVVRRVKKRREPAPTAYAEGPRAAPAPAPPRRPVPPPRPKMSHQEMVAMRQQQHIQRLALGMGSMNFKNVM